MSHLVYAFEQAERYSDSYGDPLATPLVDVLRALVGDVEALKQAATRPAPADGMTRAEALKVAREHVEAMSTNGRGYQDGVTLSDKVAAVDRMARFLMGESE